MILSTKCVQKATISLVFFCATGVIKGLSSIFNFRMTDLLGHKYISTVVKQLVFCCYYYLTLLGTNL